MNDKQNIMVYCSCRFTYLGLEHAIISHSELSQQINLMPYSKFRFFSPNYPTPDVLILVQDRNIIETLMMLDTQLEERTRVVLISSQDSPNGIKRYLFRRMNIQAELNGVASIEVLQSLLVGMLGHPLQTRKYYGDIRALSRRELDVIRRLLSGKSGMQVARDLGLSCKTVSTHKRNALLKLGERSLHGLVANGESLIKV